MNKSSRLIQISICHITNKQNKKQLTKYALHNIYPSKLQQFKYEVFHSQINTSSRLMHIYFCTLILFISSLLPPICSHLTITHRWQTNEKQKTNNKLNYKCLAIKRNKNKYNIFGRTHKKECKYKTKNKVTIL